MYIVISQKFNVLNDLVSNIAYVNFFILQFLLLEIW